jgi:hypothetical protein
VQIDYALVADYAEVSGGKLYLMGGGWDTFTVAEVPASIRMAVVAGVRVGWEETNQRIPVRIFIEDDDGKELVRIEGEVNMGRPPGLPPGSTQLSQVAANLPLTAPAHGGYRVRVVAGEGEAAQERSLPFRVVPRQG